jgi:hypothetical protein
MYNITDYTKLQAKEINVIVKPSKRKNKKIDVFDKQGNLICSVGAYGMMDYPTYIKTRGILYAKERRRLFYERFNNIKHGTDLWFSAYLLW